ncbi:MAG: hypothetical protein EPO07_09105 [Verrucomicrobia bacterium]|nr:MAG: hypothetical protein EPO07_09105 [Verrucomicrobiota bacterium]
MFLRQIDAREVGCCSTSQTMNPAIESPVTARSSIHSAKEHPEIEPRRKSRHRRERREGRWTGLQVSVLIVGVLLAIALVIAVFVVSANLR